MPFVVSRLWMPLVAAALLGGGCNSLPEETAPGGGLAWVSRPRVGRITHIVVHHTSSDLARSLSLLSGLDPSRRVSAHYLVTDESPARVVALVPEERVAFHAGVSHWRGLEGLNEVSVGVEIVNPDGNLHPYPETQVAAVAELLDRLVRRHAVEPRNLVAHSDIAPGRKVDPGALFPWERLHRERGLGTWPSEAHLRAERDRDTPLPSPAESRNLLRAWGHPVGNGPHWDDADRAALAAVQRRYRPGRVDGVMDAESAAILRALLATYPDPR